MTSGSPTLRLLLVGLVGFLLLGLGGTASASHDGWPHGRVDSVAPVRDAVEVGFVGAGLPKDAELRPQHIRVRLDDQHVDATVLPADGRERPAALARRSMLVVDTSGSMTGERIAHARAAAEAYLEQVPIDVEVGLMRFSASPGVAVAPTLDRQALLVGIQSLGTDGDTALYDAVLAASEALGSEGDRRVLVLSDGEDTASRTSLTAAESAVATGGVTLDSVVLGDVPLAVAALRRLTDVGRGRLVRVDDPAAMRAAFEGVAHEFEPRLLLHVPVPDDLAGRTATLHVEVGSSYGVLRDSAPVVLRARPEGAGVGAPGVALVAALAAAVLLAVRMRAGDHSRGKSRVEQRLAAYSLDHTGGPEEMRPARGLRASLGSTLRLVEHLLTVRGLQDRVALRLDRAGSRLTASEWVLFQVALAVGALALVGLVAGWTLGIVAALVIAGLTHAWIGRKAKSRAVAFTAELPDALQLIASGLSSGYSMPQALDSVLREGREPVAGEFGRALAEARLGIALEDALDTVAARMASQDFSWVVMAIRTQREVGGNLAEIITTLATTMRDRTALRRQVKALSAEGRLSTYVLIALPVALFAYMATVSGEYFSVMWEEPMGIALLAGSAVALLLGGAWMSKLAKVEF